MVGNKVRDCTELFFYTYAQQDVLIMQSYQDSVPISLNYEPL